MPSARDFHLQSSRLLLASGAVAVAAFAYRFVVFNGFSNDHYMHLAWGQQIARGAVPGRDFMEPGMPLTVALSALAQLAGGRGIVAELLLCIGMVAATAGLTCWLAARFSGSLLLGVAAAAMQIAIHPRLYNYPKYFVPVVGVALIWWYVDRPSTRRAALVGAWITAGFLFRHDYVLYLALGAGAAFALLASSHGLGAIARHTAACSATAAVLVLPYLLILSFFGGLQWHVRDAVQFAQGEDNQWTFSLPAFIVSLPESASDPAVRSPGDAQGTVRVTTASLAQAASRVVNSANATALLYYAIFLMPTALLAVFFLGALRRHPRRVTSREVQIVALVVITLSLAVVVVRHPIDSRLVDAGGPMPLVLAAALSGLASRGLTGRVVAVTTVAAALVAVVVHGDVRGRLEDADAFKGPRPLAAKFRNVWSEVRTPPWEDYWPAGEIPRSVRYLRECTGEDDRVVVTWFAPEIFTFADRGFGAGHAIFIRRSFYAPDFQRRMIAWLERERAPVALINVEQEWFGDRLPFLQYYLDEQYTIVGTDRFREDEVALAIRRNAKPTGVYAATGWPCFR